MGKNAQKITLGIMATSMVLSAIAYFFLAGDILPLGAFALRFAGGFFLLVFVLLHSCSRYGTHMIAMYFFITAAITWSLESLSIKIGFPFGNFHYTELLGYKIGEVPILIIAAYFFNGYLSWTVASLFWGSMGKGLDKKNLFRIPLLASILMLIWNLSFDPIMSSIEGNWVWENNGIYFGVPLSNFAGWLLTNYLVFQTFALLLYKKGYTGSETISNTTWYLIPVMYLIQGLPSLLYPFFRHEHTDIYEPIALITLSTMAVITIANLLVIHTRLSGFTWREYIENNKPRKRKVSTEPAELHARAINAERL